MFGFNRTQPDSAMININEENLVPLREVPALLLRRGAKRVHTSTVFRWARRGVNGPTGERVVLETIRYGAAVCTSTEALQRFVEQLSRVPIEQAPTPVPRTGRTRPRSAATARSRREILGKDSER